MKFYHFIGRLLSPFAALGFATHQLLFRTPRARVIVWNENNELLLVRNWAGKQRWGLPGGGVERRESPRAAAKRELFEEVGVSVADDQLVFVGTFYYKYEAPVYCVSIRRDSVPVAAHNPKEIVALEWFSPDRLPTDVSPLVLLALKELSKTS